jgi:hypothetical protein
MIELYRVRVYKYSCNGMFQKPELEFYVIINDLLVKVLLS